MFNLSIFLSISFVLSIILTMFTIKYLNKFGIISEDLHKKGKPKIPKMGGVSIVISFSISLLVIYLTTLNMVFLVILFVFFISAIIGLLDDIFCLSSITKLFLSGLAAIPLFVFFKFEPKFVVFIFVMMGVVSNLTNMLAGFNGLEVGTGMIVCIIIALKNIGSIISNIMFLFATILLGFLLFNKYPAKIFLGDVGTLPIGAMVVIAHVLGANLLTIVILLIPYIIDMLLKLISVGIMNRSEHKATKLHNGYLKPQDGYLSLSKIIMKIHPLKEWQLVIFIWSFEIMLGIIVLFVL